jgi:hypothetical protein
MEGDPDGVAKAFALPFPERAEDAVATTEAWWTRWRAAVQALDDEALWQPIGRTSWCGELGEGTAAMGLGPDDPVVNFLLHHQRELIHHGAEISLLRDLFRAEHG